MLTGPKRWQTELWIGERIDQPVTIYGESLAQLRTVTLAWLTENKPLAFGNVPSDYAVLEQIKRYFYSDGSREIVLFSLDSSESTATLERGWYYIEDSVLYPRPQRLAGFDHAATHYVENALIPAQGPEFKEPPSTNNNAWAGRIGHPAVLGGIFGVMTSLCYLGLPISGGYELNFVLAQRNVGSIVLFAFFMMMVFGVVGAVVSKSFSKFRTR